MKPSEVSEELRRLRDLPKAARLRLVAVLVAVLGGLGAWKFMGAFIEERGKAAASSAASTHVAIPHEAPAAPAEPATGPVPRSGGAAVAASSIHQAVQLDGSVNVKGDAHIRGNVAELEGSGSVDQRFTAKGVSLQGKAKADLNFTKVKHP